MARSSQGPRRVTTWTAEQNQGAMPRIVRLGRPANDNVRSIDLTTRMIIAVGTVAAATVFVVIDWFM